MDYRRAEEKHGYRRVNYKRRGGLSPFSGQLTFQCNRYHKRFLIHGPASSLFCFRQGRCQVVATEKGLSILLLGETRLGELA